MPDFSGSNQRSTSWISANRPSEVLELLVKALQARNGQLEVQTDQSIEMTLGSRSGFRILGMITPKRMMPLRLSVTVTPETDHSSRVLAEATSTEGHYVIEVSSIVKRKYNAAFDDLFDRLRKVAIPT